MQSLTKNQYLKYGMQHVDILHKNNLEVTQGSVKLSQNSGSYKYNLQYATGSQTQTKKVIKHKQKVFDLLRILYKYRNRM